MNTLPTEVYEYLAKTGKRMDFEGLQTKWQTSSKRMADALNALLSANKIIKETKRKQTSYFAIGSTQEDTHQPLAFRPYQPPKVLTELHRNLEAFREQYPSGLAKGR